MAELETLTRAHYATDGLYGRIMDALGAAGIGRDALTPDHLKGVDEFHIGGAEATVRLLDPLQIGPATRVLDIGSGIGGPARFMARRYGAQVTGLDLTPEFVDTARALDRDLGIAIDYAVGSALDMPFADNRFDVATLLHVGMNLPDKARLFAEVARVLVPGGTFAVYDVMLLGDHPDLPVPWASTRDASFATTPDAYRAAAAEAGFTPVSEADRGDEARAFYAERARRAKAGDTGPAATLPLLMGDTAPQKLRNMTTALAERRIAPVEMIFRKSG